MDPLFDFDVSKYPPLPPARGLFITGTDTEVGKTIIAGAIARQLRSQGRLVEVFKPVATGCRLGRDGLISADADFLAACADSRQPLAQIAPLRYATAVSPNLAAKREHRPIDLPALFDAYKRMLAGTDGQPPQSVIVEGVGGLLCPISDDFWVIHFAKLTRLPVVIVARAGLGTINHTLLTLQVARAAGLHVAGVVINRYLLEPVPGKAAPSPAEPYLRGDEEISMFTNPQQIAELGKVDLLALVPQEAETSVEQAKLGPDTQFAISQVNWEKLMAP